VGVRGIAVGAPTSSSAVFAGELMLRHPGKLKLILGEAAMDPSAEGAVV
jgi:hypothetical protein